MKAATENSSRLEGQTALVTGASSGIGAAIARQFAQSGAAVGINYKSDPTEAEQIVREISANGDVAISLQADVSRQNDVQRMIETFVGEFGRLDILVTNAGIQMDAPINKMTEEEWRRVIDVNLTGQFLCARAAIAQFAAQPEGNKSKTRGKIICISSVHETIPWAGRVNYAASKGGVMMMMKSLAQETAHLGIRVNGIAPGAIKTSINREAWETPEAREALLKLIPYGRIGDPADIALAALWLASDLSDYVIGTTLFVDGGMSLYPSFREGG